MREVLTGSPSNDHMLKCALEAIGYTDGRPLLHAGHPVYDAATCNDARAAVLVPNTTKTPGSSIADLANPLFREFHEALCQYNLIPTSS